MPPHCSEEGGNFFPERSLMGRGCPGRGWSAHPWRWHSGLDDKVGTGQSWNSVTWEGFSRLRDSGIPQKTKRFDRVKGEVGEDLRQKDCGKQGALSPLSPISPSLPAQLFCPCSIGAAGIPPRHSRGKPFCRVENSFSRHAKPHVSLFPTW